MRSLLLSLLIAPAALAQNFDTIQVRATQVTRGVYMLTGSGGNMGLSVGDDMPFLVDDQFAPLSAKIKAAIATVTPKPVRFVFNTHWHFDHTGGNEAFGQDGAIVIAHENARKRLSKGQLIEALQREIPASPRAALPVVTFNDGVSFHINGDSLVAWHLAPAHTDGDAVVFFKKANVVHMGDVFLSAGFPFVDLSSGGSIQGIIAGTARVLKEIGPDTKIIPGHGPLADKARLQAYHDMLGVMVTRMRREIANKQTIEQVLGSKITADYDTAWPGGRERFLRILHQELSRK
jgi:cyclase